MAKSFGLSTDDENEIVQQMYVRLIDYVDNPKKIMYNDKEVNTFYVYVTLRNLYLSGFYKMNKAVLWDPLEFSKLEHLIDNSSKTYEEKFEFDKLINKIESEVDKWYWYDKRIFNIHFNDGMSMRKIAKETKISLSSIFNTLSNSKDKIKKKNNKDYEDYKETKS